MKTVFDHIAITAPSLDKGVADIENHLGIRFAKGGQHPNMGTHNRLTALGPDTFAEIISIDPNAPNPNRARWFALDTCPPDTRLAAWLLRTDDIEGCINAAASLGIDLGTAVPQTRGDLSWRFTVTDDGHIPLGGIAPLILRWDTDGPHPASTMLDQGLRLTKLSIKTTDPDRLNAFLDVINLTDRPEITKSSIPNLSATFTIEDKELTL